MAVDFLTFAIDGLVDADSWRANAGDVKKNQQARWLDYFSPSTLTFFALLSVLLTEFPLFDG